MFSKTLYIIFVNRLGLLLTVTLIYFGQWLLIHSEKATYIIAYFATSVTLSTLVVIYKRFRSGIYIILLALISNSLIIVYNYFFACKSSSNIVEIKILERIFLFYPSRCGFNTGLYNYFSRTGQILFGLAWILSIRLGEFYDSLTIIKYLVPKKFRLSFKLYTLVAFKVFDIWKYDLLKSIHALKIKGVDVFKFWRINNIVVGFFSVLKIALQVLLRSFGDFFYLVASHNFEKNRPPLNINAYLININNFSLTYTGERYLNNISLKAKKGEVIALRGRDNAGKSTLLKVISGYIPLVDEKNYLITGEVDILGSKFDYSNDYARQAPVLLNSVSIVSNDIFNTFIGIKIKHELMCFTNSESQAMNALKRFGMEGFWERELSTLSGGESVKVMLCALHLKNPHIIILDDISGQLDHESRIVLFNEIRLYKSYGKCIILADANLDIFSEIIDQVLTIEDGTLVQPSRYVGNVDLPRLLPNEMSLNPLISLKGLFIGYPGNVLLKGVDLEIFKGDFLLIKGNNGSGKTTFADVIAGIKKPLKGTIVRNKGVQIGYVFQNHILQITEDNVERELLFGPVKPKLQKNQQEEYLNGGYEFAHLKGSDRILLAHNSNLRLLEIYYMVQRYDLVILDEPTNNCDSLNKYKIIEFINNGLAMQISFLVISHDTIFDSMPIKRYSINNLQLKLLQ